MGSKKKASSKIVFNIPVEMLHYIKENYHENLMCKVVMDIITANNGLEQISIIKKLEKDFLQVRAEELKQNIKSEILCEIVAVMAHQSNSYSLKKAFIKLLQEISRKNPDAVNMWLETFIKHLSSLDTSTSMGIIVINIGCISDILEHLEYGHAVINNNTVIVWGYISKSLSTTLSALENESNPSKRSELFAMCQMILKTAILILQQCNDFVQHLQRKDDEHLNVFSDQILHNVQVLLNSDGTIFNCRINAAMVLFLYLKATESLEFERALGFKTLPEISQLCILSAVMAIYPFNDEQIAHKYLFLYEVLQEIFDISQRVDDSEQMLMSGRNMLQWTNIMCQALSSSDTSGKKVELSKCFSKDILFEYVLNNRNHFIDSLRYVVKEIFQNYLILQLLIEDKSPETLQAEIINAILKAIPFHDPGKYDLLGCAVKVFKTDTTQHLPLLLTELFSAMSDKNLIPHIVELLDSLFKNTTEATDFETHFITSILCHLQSTAEEQAESVIQHVLPKLLRACPTAVDIFFREIYVPGQKSYKKSSLHLLLICMKFCENSSENILTIYDSLMETAMCHDDHQIRLSAFAILCDASKQGFSLCMTKTLALIRQSLPFNISIQCCSFRQQFLSYMKKLFFKIEKSNSVEMKKKQFEVGSKQEVMCAEYKEFLEWLEDFLYFCLQPGANFSRRVTALNLLYIMQTVYHSSPLLDPSICVQTLIYILQDSYENNKSIALDMISDIHHSTDIKDIIPIKNLFKTALSLMSSAKPTETVTASYMFALIVRLDKNICDIAKLYEHFITEDIFNEYTDGNYIIIYILTLELNRQLKNARNNLLHAAANGPLYGVIACIREALLQINLSNKEMQYVTHWTKLLSKLIVLCMEVAEIVEPVLCSSSPEGYLPMDTDSGRVTELQAAIRQAMGLRFHSAVVVENGEAKPDTVAVDIVKTHAVTAQMLLLCCWRAHKEVSLLFGEIVERCHIVENENGSMGMLTITQIMNIGEYFIHQLSTVKHRGAFEQAYVGFCKLCHKLWRCSITRLSELPLVWLHDILSTVKGEKEYVKFCPTRRSAGLPYIIQGLLISEPKVTGSSTFKNVMTTLLQLASVPPTDKVDSQVHAMNILRALFRDACLGENVMPFISQGLIIAILGFKSKHWAIRNCATLLFSSLMTRLFGVNRCHDEAAKKNRLTGKMFFFRYKELYCFLHDELQQCAASLTNKNLEILPVVPSLYPVLLILGRLYPVPGESDIQLEALVPYLHICASSPVWKIRVLAARALIPLLSLKNFASNLKYLFNFLPSDPETIVSQNAAHGVLLEVLYILKAYSTSPIIKKSLSMQSLKTWTDSNFKLILSCKYCYTVKTTFLNIIFELMCLGTFLDNILLECLIEVFVKELPIMLYFPDRDSFLAITVIVVLFHFIHLSGDTNCHSFFEKQVLELIPSFLKSENSSVKCAALDFVIWLFQGRECNFELNSFILLENIKNQAISLTKCNKSYLISYLSNQSFYESICIMAEEDKPNYLGKIYELMCTMSDEIINFWDASNLCQKLEFIVVRLNQYSRDEILCPLLYFSANLVIHTYHSIQKKIFNIAHEDVKHSCINSLKNWCEVIENTANAEHSFIQRKTAAHVLKHVCPLLCLDEAQIIGDTKASLWQALLYILVDDEPEIRHTAFEVVESLKIYSKDIFVHPGTIQVAPHLNLMMQAMTSIEWNSSPRFMKLLLRWMLNSEIDGFEKVIDEQPFDKKEMNVYAEDYIITLSAYETLHSAISHVLCSKDAALFTALNAELSLAEIPFWRTLEDREYSLAEIINLCLSELETLVSESESDDVIPFFVDTYYDKNLLRASQHLHTIDVLLPLLLNSDLNVYNRMLLIQGKIENFTRTKFVHDMLSLSRKICSYCLSETTIEVLEMKQIAQVSMSS